MECNCTPASALLLDSGERKNSIHHRCLYHTIDCEFRERSKCVLHLRRIRVSSNTFVCPQRSLCITLHRLPVASFPIFIKTVHREPCKKKRNCKQTLFCAIVFQYFVLRWCRFVASNFEFLTKHKILHYRI